MATVTLTTTSGSPQTWPVPGDCPAGTVLTVEAWGAGGAGSGRVSTNYGSAGDGGHYAQTYYTVTSSDVTNGITYTLQPGATGTSGSDPSAGADTSFGTAPKNLLPNSSNYGAVAGTLGSGGVLPSGWTTTQAGLQLDVSLGTDGGTGYSYVGLNYHGTTNATSFSLNMVNNAAGGGYMPATDGLRYTDRMWLGLAATGTGWTNITGGGPNFNTNWQTNTGAYINTQGGAGNYNPSVAALAAFTTANMLAPATTACANVQLVFSCSSGVAVNFTLLIGGHQFEQGTVATSFLSTPAGYVLAKGGSGPVGITAGTHLFSGLSMGIVVFKGGNGAAYNAAGAGGGGAAGPAAAGSNGNTSGQGGQGDGSSGGAGGAVKTTNPGNPGISNVLGGGGGGGLTTVAGTGGAGGDPGGGGGGAVVATGTGGNGGRAQINITYTPSATAWDGQSNEAGAGSVTPTGVMRALATDIKWTTDDIGR